MTLDRWPFPVHPEEVVARRGEVRTLIAAALAEVGVTAHRVNESGGGVYWNSEFDDLIRAQRVAYLSLRIDFDNVTPEEYQARFAPLGSAGRTGIVGYPHWLSEQAAV